jgi:enamidase
LEEVEEVVKGTRLPFEIAFNGNPLVASRALAWALEKGWEHRVVLGTDSPTGGAGYSPLALLKLIVQVTSVHGVPAPKALCMATGNTASVFGLKAGKIERGLAADLVVLDRPKGSSARDALGAMEYGDVPGVAAVLTAGRPRLLRSAFTPPPEREVHVRAMPMN